MMIYAGAAAIAMAFILTLLGTSLTRRLAVRLGFMDTPQRHKAHGQPVPLLGGSAIFAGILLPSMLALALACIWANRGSPAWLPQSLANHMPGVAAKATQAIGILLAALGLHVVGLVDDRKGLGPWTKLTFQVLAAVGVTVFCGVRILTFAGPAVSVAATILWLVAITNAFNFLDNMDGLCAGVAAIAAAALLAAAASIGQIFVSAWLCLILGSALGFLPYNFPKASTFMGDAGSMVIGFLLGVASCLTTYLAPTGSSLGPATASHYALLAPLVIMAVPLYDAVSVVLLRLRERRNPMIGDRRHFSHRLVHRGMSVRTADMTIYLCTAGTAIAAALLPRVDAVGAGLVFAQTVAILMIIALLESPDAKN